MSIIRDVNVAPDGDGFTVQIGDEPPIRLGRVELILLRVQSDKLLASDQVLHEYLVTAERILKGIVNDDPTTAAECSLTADDVLESGVEIIAQPPGKLTRASPWRATRGPRARMPARIFLTQS